jgi:3-oxoacyl-(acyl-carrier-protein) synthase
MKVQIIDLVSIDESPADLDTAYAVEVDWQQGYRLNPDSRLILLGVKRVLKRLSSVGDDGSEGFDRLRTALVFGSAFGSLCSYEAFFDSTKKTRVEPLAYTYAMPSTPTAAASICFRLLGPTITVSGEEEAGIAALKNSITMLAIGRCDLAITGCWHAPSQTTRKEGLPERAQLLLLALQRPAAANGPFASVNQLARADIPFHSAGSRRSCVEVLGDWLVANQQDLVEPAEFMPGAIQ